jgi:hypothetical protein
MIHLWICLFANVLRIGQTAVGQTAVGQTAVGQTAVGQTAVRKTAVGQTAGEQTVVEQKAPTQKGQCEFCGKRSLLQAEGRRTKQRGRQRRNKEAKLFSVLHTMEQFLIRAIGFLKT